MIMRPTMTNNIPFNDFWSIWPKKTAKKAAEKAWNKAKVDVETFIVIQAHLEVAYLTTEKQYIPNPATYINGERWNDEVIVGSLPVVQQDQFINPNNTIDHSEFLDKHFNNDWAKGIL